MNELRKAAETVLLQCMGGKPGETVCIVYDAPKKDIALALAAVAEAAGLEPVAVQMKVRSRDGEEPPQAVAAAMLHADVVLCVTSRSLSHTKARRDSNAQGARIASLPGVTEDMLVRTMQADYKDVARVGEVIREKLQGIEEVHVTSPAGTDLYLPIGGRSLYNDTGLLHGSGEFGNLPAGEVAVSPVEGKAHGVLVVDGSMSGVGKLDEPLRIVVEDGFATEISGGSGGNTLSGLLAPIGRLAYNIAELGIGTNPAAIVTGKVLEDEKVLGTIHVALGNNLSMNGTVDVPIHLDGIVLKPTVVLDGQAVIMKDGELLVG